MRLNRIGIAALLATTAFIAPAHAQAAQSAQADESKADEKEDIIYVTATRRAENVQDIPIAVTAVSPAQLENQGVVNVQEISQVSPSFSTSQAQNSSSTVVLRIRGVGTTSNNIGFESAVGIFVDGVYQSRPGVALSEFVDVERLEILRGPQGTLFGRNTSAGALTLTNKKPDVSELGGFVNATYGNYDHFSLQGAVNIPLVQDTLALRLTGAYRNRDGFVDVVNADGDKVGESNDADQYLIRGQLGYEGESGIEARLIFDYSNSEGACCSSVEIQASPVETLGGFQAVGLGARGGMAGLNRAVGNNDNAAAQAAVDDLRATANFAPSSDVDQWGITGEISVPLSDDIDLIYIGSYRDFDSSEGYDSDFSGLDVFNVVDQRTDIQTMTHEIRFQGEVFDGRLSWLVGGYYSDEDITQEIDYALGAQYDAFIGGLIFGATGGAFGNQPLAILSGGASAADSRATNRFTQNSKSWSIFTHNTFDITDNWSVTAGLRWSDENKSGSFSQPSVNNPVCNGVLGTIGAGGVPGPLVNTVFVTGCLPFVAPADLPASAVFPLPRTFDNDFNDDELIWTVKSSYAFDGVPINVYASFTHGYKSGGFNLDTTGAAGGADPRFASEEVDAYEVGMKAQTDDGSLTANIAFFYENFENFQVLEFTGAQFQTFNVPRARSKGFEIETAINPADGLTFNVGFTYVDADYPSNCAGDNGPLRVQNLCGHDLTNAPQYIAISGANYESTLGDQFRFFLNGQVRVEGDRRTSTQARLVPATEAELGNTPLNPFDRQDSNIKINLRAGFGDIDEAWTVEGWVTNLTNEKTRGVTFNTVLRGGSRSAFLQSPRMYGVTLRGKF